VNDTRRTVLDALQSLADSVTAVSKQRVTVTRIYDIITTPSSLSDILHLRGERIIPAVLNHVHQQRVELAFRNASAITG